MNKTDQLISSGGVDVRSVDDLNEEVLNRWRRLVGITEERNKLIKAGVVCYKTLHQGVSFLDILFRKVFLDFFFNSYMHSDEFSAAINGIIKRKSLIIREIESVRC